MYGRVVSAHVVKDMRGRSSSFGYVELSNSDEVDDLIHALDGADFLGSILYVSRTAHRVFQRQ
ncbi:RNA recognition motif domain-containing protein [Candidatus Nitrospira bockiana]